MELNKKTLNLIIYAAIIIFAVLFLYIGNMVASSGASIDYPDYGIIQTAEAKVNKITDIEELDIAGFHEKTIIFEAKLTSGENKGKIITAEQSLGGYYGPVYNEVAEGDNVILSMNYDGNWYFADHVRVDKIWILGVIFIILLLFFGRIKGLNAVFSLGFTCAAIFCVFIPAILSGKNIYLTAVIICVYSILVTIFIVYGVNKKSLAAAAGCFGGVIAAGLLTLIMSAAMRLTGVLDEESLALIYIQTEKPIDLKAIVFAGIVIGAVGAIMDVAVSISSSLSEIKAQAADMSFGALFKSGVNIGKDIMGSMTNTLVLAYIGSSLSVILLLLVKYNNSITELLNRELIVVELLQSLIGSLGILLTMPLTALVCAALYSRKPKPKDDDDDDFEIDFISKI